MLTIIDSGKEAEKWLADVLVSQGYELCELSNWNQCPNSNAVMMATHYQDNSLRVDLWIYYYDCEKPRWIPVQLTIGSYIGRKSWVIQNLKRRHGVVFLQLEYEQLKRAHNVDAIISENQTEKMQLARKRIVKKVEETLKRESKNKSLLKIAHAFELERQFAKRNQ